MIEAWQNVKVNDVALATQPDCYPFRLRVVIYAFPKVGTI